jgi:hypothetical protein
VTFEKPATSGTEDCMIRSIALAFASLAVPTGLALADEGGAPPPPPASPTASAWSQIDTRPLVLPANKIEAHGGLPILALANGTGGTATGEAMAFGGTFGVVDKVEAGLDYAFPLHPNGDLGSGVLQLHGAYAALHSDKLDLAIAAELEFNLRGTTEYQIDLAAWLRYRIAPKLSIFTGQPATPTTISGFSSFLAPPIAYQLTFGLNNSQPTFLSLPIGVGFQATPQLYLFGETSIAEIFITNGPMNAGGGTTNASFIFSDAIPLGLGAFFSVSDQLDVGAVFADDLKNAGDLYVFTLAGRFYIK